MQTCHRYKQSLLFYWRLLLSEACASESPVVYLFALHKYGLCAHQTGGKKEVKRHFEHIALCTHIPANLQQISTHLFYQSSVARAVYRLLTL